MFDVEGMMLNVKCSCLVFDGTYCISRPTLDHLVSARWHNWNVTVSLVLPLIMKSC